MSATLDFRSEREALVRGDARGQEFSRAYASLVDAWIAELLGEEDDVAVVALGSYARRELAPGSDIDVALFHRGRTDVREVAERLWYPMWDTGVKVGHAVRTVREALALASTDVEVATSLLDARPVAGDLELGAEVAEAAVAQWRKRSTSLLEALGESVRARHARSGEVAFLLEPDLKSGRGGLRDVHTLRWVGLAVPVTYDVGAVDAAHDALLEVRIALHRVTSKAHDVLWLQDQDAVSDALGDPNADVLMARVASAARAIAWASDEVWEELGPEPSGRRRRHVSRDRELAPGIVLREGVAELAGGIGSEDPELVLRLGAAAAQHEVRVGRGSLERFASQMHVPGTPWPRPTREGLVALLASGRSAIPVLEALDQHQLLARLVPEWEMVRSRPQRNAYHRFTVDRHLCETAAEAAALVGRVRRPDLLLLAAWLHDIGKGYTGRGGEQRDHTELGVELIGTIATRMGFPAADVLRLQDLVRHHLLLADTATRRDLNDPATIVAVARAVHDRDTLALLHALTEADSVATGPAAWSNWKEGLLAELVARTDAYLRGESLDDSSSADDQATAALIAEARRVDRPLVEVHGGELTVVAPDRRGLFCRVAGTLTLAGMNVLSARAWATDDGIAVETFVVEPQFDDPDWNAVRVDLERAIAGRVALSAKLAARSRTYGADRSTAAEPARRAVVIDNEATPTATVVEVRAPDRPGVLYRVTRALAELDLDVRHAKVVTLGHEVVDTFYVVDERGAKITDAEDASEVERAVLFELDQL